jgi:hypothetical protein
MTSNTMNRKSPTALTAELARHIQLGKLAYVAEYREPGWLQVTSGESRGLRLGPGIYYLIRVDAPAPTEGRRQSYNITMIDRIFTFVSNCLGEGDELLPPTRQNSGLAGSWDSKVAQFLAGHNLLTSTQGLPREWRVGKGEAIAFLRKINTGEIPV